MKQTRQDNISKNRPVSLREQLDRHQTQNQSCSATYPKNIFNIDRAQQANSSPVPEASTQARAEPRNPATPPPPFKQTITPFVQRIIKRCTALLINNEYNNRISQQSPRLESVARHCCDPVSRLRVYHSRFTRPFYRFTTGRG